MNDTNTDIEAIERATVAAVAPETVVEWNGWLLPFDRGTIGRAKAAVPLHHGPAPHDAIDAIEAHYRERGLPCVMRLADVPALAPLTEALARRGYVGAKSTLVQVGTARRMQQVSSGAPATIDAHPDAAWTALFLGDGADPVDGANRARALSRAPDSRYASVLDEDDGGCTLACGALVFGQGWAGVHGMRTDAAQRGRGLAGRVLAGLAEAALAKGVERVFLQVEAHNAAALALYRRAGFETAWRYRYWQRV